ncbi:MAG: LPS export ABC transporter permease LptG [Gammaproteobacteria bacterium]|nr:LPS export ABC transporter permease LptG [Gammaproteobacteria bacterium]
MAEAGGGRGLMSVISGYLGRVILRASALVLAVLLALGGFIEFVGQLDDIGVGNYGVVQGLLYALMKVPEMAFVMLPMATLLGGLVGFGALASGSEMIALRSAGVSPAKLAGSVAITGVGLALFSMVLGLYLAPPLERYSRQYRTFAMHGPSGRAGTQSAWVRDGATIMNVSHIGDPADSGGVYLFRLGGPGRIDSIARADSAGIGAGGEWALRNFAESRFGAEGVTVRREREFAEVTGLSPELLSLTVVRPEALNAFALWRYAQYLRSNGLDSHRFEVAFWARIASAVAVAPMSVLALSFAFGQVRRAGTGGRIIVGIVVGLAYFLISRALADGGEVYDLHPVLVGWLPTILLLAATLAALARAR